MERSVLVWQETIVLPTYNTGTPEKNPIFLEKRVYQGSSGTVYPHAVVEKIEDEKKDKEYTALFLENDYLKIMILPELGGRVHRAEGWDSPASRTAGPRPGRQEPGPSAVGCGGSGPG